MLNICSAIVLLGLFSLLGYSSSMIIALLSLLSVVLITLWSVIVVTKISFLPFSLIIAYTGGILILFLFVVILFEIDFIDFLNYNYFYDLLYLVTMYFVFSVSGLVFLQNIIVKNSNIFFPLEFFVHWDINQIANSLYSQQATLFLGACVLLLIALVSSVTIALRSISGIGFVFLDVTEYNFIVLFVLLAALISIVLVTVSYFLSKSAKPSSEKLGEYECGFDPFDNATKLPFDIHFYIIGVLFLIFDVEVILVIPWAIKPFYSNKEFLIMVFFLVLLLVGFICEWYNGVLSWPTRKFNTETVGIILSPNAPVVPVLPPFGNVINFLNNCDLNKIWGLFFRNLNLNVLLLKPIIYFFKCCQKFCTRLYAFCILQSIDDIMQFLIPSVVILICLFLAKAIMTIISIAYYTLAERKVMGAVQRRLGPNKVGFWGSIQPLADGGKLIFKELIIPLKAIVLIFIASPISTFILSVSSWIVVPGFYT